MALISESMLVFPNEAEPIFHGLIAELLATGFEFADVFSYSLVHPGNFKSRENATYNEKALNQRKPPLLDLCAAEASGSSQAYALGFTIFDARK